VAETKGRWNANTWTDGRRPRKPDPARTAGADAAAARIDHGRRPRDDAERRRDGRAPGRAERRGARTAGNAGPAERGDPDRRRGGRALQAAARGRGLTLA